MLEWGERVVLSRRAAHLYQARRSADERRPARRFVIVLRESPHERKGDVHVGIDEAREHKLPRGIDDLGSRRGGKASSDRRDRFVLAVDIRHVTGVRRDHFAILDQEAHEGTLCVKRAWRKDESRALPGAKAAGNGWVFVRQ